jgi:hypothetical protein
MLRSRSPCFPTFRQIGKLTQGRVALVHSPEADYPRVGWIIGGATEKLPAPIIGIMGHVKHRSSFEHLAGGDRCGLGRVFEWPWLHQELYSLLLIGSA